MKTTIFFATLLMFCGVLTLQAKDELKIENPRYDAKEKKLHYELVNVSGEEIVKYSYDIDLKLDKVRVEDLVGGGVNLQKDGRLPRIIDLDKALSSRELRKISASPKIKIDCSTRSIEFKGGKITRKFGERKVKRIR